MVSDCDLSPHAHICVHAIEHKRSITITKIVTSVSVAEEMDQEVLDVLFEFRESRRQLSVAPSDVCEVISGEMSSLVGKLVTIFVIVVLRLCSMACIQVQVHVKLRPPGHDKYRQCRAKQN